MRVGNFLNAKCKGANSMFWKGMVKVKDSISKGVCKMVGKGESINILTNTWIPKV